MPEYPIEMKVLMNHIYEYEKGVRRLVLYTFNACYAAYAVEKLERKHIDYILRSAGRDTVNLFFGKKECIAAIGRIVEEPFGRNLRQDFRETRKRNDCH